MALVPATCAAALWTAYSPIVLGTPVNYAPAFASAYETYASAGTVPGATNTGGTESILEAFVAAVISRVETIDEFAQALADYWATVAITPGSPAHGGTSVTSVVNDALSQVAAFRSAIVASITDVDTAPYFEQLIVNIENIGVSAVTWTVTELIGGVPTPFSENIS